MAIDAQTVRKVAGLARIAIAEDRLAPMAAELTGILAWIEQLAEVDTSDIEPMTSAVALPLAMREDVVSETTAAADILGNAPKARGGFFVAPKAVE
ncbi:MAG TPA: Asp-tRNA(Asn)/Glu-tRNA(Gln) amidotransferase subunit GatC [Caulobacteraceae bacterium]